MADAVAGSHGDQRTHPAHRQPHAGLTTRAGFEVSWIVLATGQSLAEEPERLERAAVDEGTAERRAVGFNGMVD